MIKTLLLRLSIGRFPAAAKAELQLEGIDFLEEGIWGSATYINYKAPGRRSNWKRSGFLGSIALTPQRIVAYGWAARLLDIPYDHPTLAAVHFTLDEGPRLRISYDASQFHADRSGQIELRFRTPQAAHILDLLQHRSSHPGRTGSIDSPRL